MLIKKSQVLLFCSVSLMLYSVSAMEEADPNRDDPGGYVVKPNLLVVGVVTDPQIQYEVGLNLIDSLQTIGTDQQIPRLREVVEVLTLSANGNCEQAKNILPVWQHNLGVSLYNTSDGLALDQRISRLEEVLKLFTLSTEGGHGQAKEGLHRIQYELGRALLDSVAPLVPDRLEIIPRLRQITDLFDSWAKAGNQEVEVDLRTVKFFLGCLVVKSAAGLDSEKQIPIFREAVVLLQTSPDPRKHLHIAQYLLATALHNISKKTPEKEKSLFREAFDLLCMSAEGGAQHAKTLLPSWQQGLATELANSVDELPLEQRTSKLREAVDLLNKSSSADPMYRNNFHIVQYKLASHLMELSLGCKPEERRVLLTEARKVVNGYIADGNTNERFADLTTMIDQILTHDSSEQNGDKR